MIKIRNYVTITIVIAIIFFLFASQGVARLTLSDKGVNHYAVKLSAEKKDTGITTGEQSHFVFAGKDTDLRNTAREYAALRDSSIKYTTDTGEAASIAYGYNTIVLVDGGIIDQDSIPDLKEILHKNSTIVFMTLPDEKIISDSRDLREILGIQRDRGKIHLKGYQLLPDFLAGGEAYYVEEKKDVNEEEGPRQDLPLDIYYYEVLSSSRLYMIGQIDPDKQGIKDLDDDNTRGPLDSEDYPAIIWQHSDRSGRSFMINGDFMKSDTGLGILAGIEYETLPVMISKYVDARSLLTVGFPDLADENEDEIKRLYGQSLYDFEKNSLWPFAVSAAALNNDRMTLMSVDHIKTGTGIYSRENTWFTLAENERAETGALGEQASDISAGLNAVFPDYRITGFYGSGDHGIVVNDDGADIFSQKGSTINVKQTTEADQMNYSDDLRFRSIVTATGYYLTSIDLRKVIYPKTQRDRYEKFSRRTNGNLSTYYHRYSFLTPRTLSEVGTAISEFLNTDISVKDDSINNRMVISVRSDKCSDLLVRTHDQDIVSVQGAEYRKVEDDCYILTVSEKRVVVNLADSDTPTLVE